MYCWTDIIKKGNIWKLFEQIDVGSNVSLVVNTEESKVLWLEKPYFYSGQVRKVKAIHDLIITAMAGLWDMEGMRN